MIDNHDNSESTRSEVKGAGYGKAGLNKQVVSKKNKELSDSIKSSLDDFLGGLSSKASTAQEAAPVRIEEVDIDDMRIEDINDAIIDSPIREDVHEVSQPANSTQIISREKML